MKNLIGLFEAVCDAYDNPAFLPKPDGTTFCNEAAQAICHAFECKDFDNKTADQIYAFLQSSSDWTEILKERAQDLANQGSLIFAVASSAMLQQKHGHIVAIRPGKLKDSGKWGLCPSVLEIGGENFIARAKRGPLQGMPAGLNEAFIPMPKFFVWNQSL